MKRPSSQDAGLGRASAWPAFTRRDLARTLGVTAVLPLAATSELAASQQPTAAGLADDRFPVRRQGYIGDGRSHPLGSVETVAGATTKGWTLDQWRTLFPRAAALNEEIDRHAIQRYCDLHPEALALDLPPGIALLDRGIVTGGAQTIRIRGAGRDLTEIWFSEPDGTLWTHGRDQLADGSWTVEDLTIRPKAQCAAVFDVRFSGRQPAWCHIMRNVQFKPDDLSSFFRTVCITRNIKRGLDWQNIVAYGHHFHVLPGNAFEFPSNLDQKLAGNSYNFNNIMVVGYNYALNFDFTGFTSSNNHMHEEVQLYNVQAYAGVGLLRARNGNYAYAPADNFTIIACGFQGTGPALDLHYLEHVRIRDTLFVNDVSAHSTTCFATIENCDSVLLDGNQFFSSAGTQLTGLSIFGSRTRNVTLERNDIVAYSSFRTFLDIGSDVPAGGVEERSTGFGGKAAYQDGRVLDRSGLAATETRARDAAAKAPAATAVPGTASLQMTGDGDIVWDAVIETRTIDSEGRVRMAFPPGLMRSVKSVSVENAGSETLSWVVLTAFDTSGATARLPQPGIQSGSSVRLHLRAIGR